MKTLYPKEIVIIKKNKNFLEKNLEIKIQIKDKELIIESNPFNEYIAEKVIDAINFGFSLEIAMLIKKEDFLFEVINIKEYTRRKNLQQIRARIIGTKGKTLKVLHELTKCFLELKNNEVGIIGSPESIQNAQEAIISLIRGAKQRNVYSFLEKHQVKPVFDFGLKK